MKRTTKLHPSAVGYKSDAPHVELLTSGRTCRADLELKHRWIGGSGLSHQYGERDRRRNGTHYKRNPCRERKWVIISLENIEGVTLHWDPWFHGNRSAPIFDGADILGSVSGGRGILPLTVVGCRCTVR